MTIKELRQMKGLTLAAFAKSIGIGMSTLTGYEAGKRQPGEKALAAIKEVYGVDLNSTAPSATPVEAAAAAPAEEKAVEKKAAKKPRAKKQAAPVETAPPETTAAMVETAPPATTPPATEAPSEQMVWIPTKGGQRYHSNSSCSGMEDPAYVTITEAKNKNFTPCGRCY